MKQLNTRCSAVPFINRLTPFFVCFAAEELWVHVQVAPVRNEKDVVVLFLLTFKDITAQRHLEHPALKGVQLPA